MEARPRPKPALPQAFELMLRVRHPSLDPEEISRVLRLTPDHSFQAGQPRTSLATGMSGSVCHTETYWVATLNPGSWTVDLFPDHPASHRASETINAMAKTVLARALSLCGSRCLRPNTEFLKRIQAEGGEVRLLVEINTAVLDGFTLSPEIAREMSALEIPIDFNFSAD
jgi:hypothetical protein